MDSFKSQIIHVVQSVDKLDLPDRLEAFSYLQRITEALKNNSLPSVDLSTNTFPEISSAKASNKTLKHKCKNHLCLMYNIKHLKKIACFKCDTKLDSETQLFEHSQIHLDYPLSCFHCHCLFRNTEDFTSHRASDCKQSVRDSSQNSEKYRCNVCSDSLANKKAFQSHLLDNHGMKLYNNWYSCKLCREMFEQKKMLFHHYKHAHSEMNQWKAKGEGDNITNFSENSCEQDKEVEKFQCYHCGRGFPKKNMLSIHVKRHLQNNTFTCNPCKKSYTCYKYYRRHLQTISHQNKDSSDSHPLYKCKLCENKVFVSRDLLAQHVQRYHNATEKRLKCPLCDFKTGLAASLTRHINLHTDNRKFICDQCGACFHTTSALKEHTTCIHSNERNFSCEICGQGFKLKSGLNRHFKTHSDEKDFKCCFCDQVYKFRTNLKRHLANAHKQTEKRNRVFRVTTEDEGYAMNNPKVVQRKTIMQKKPDDPEASKMDDFDISSLSVLSDVDLSCADEMTDEVLRQTYDNLAKYSAESGESQQSFRSILEPVNNIIDHVLQESSNDLHVTRLAEPTATVSSSSSIDPSKQYSGMNGDSVVQQLPPMNYRPATCRQYLSNTFADLSAQAEQYTPQPHIRMDAAAVAPPNQYMMNSFDMTGMCDGYNKQYPASQYPQDMPVDDNSCSFSYTRWLNDML